MVMRFKFIVKKKNSKKLSLFFQINFLNIVVHLFNKYLNKIRMNNLFQLLKELFVEALFKT